MLAMLQRLKIDNCCQVSRNKLRRF